MLIFGGFAKEITFAPIIKKIVQNKTTTMKKLLVILAIATVFVACNGAADTAKSAADSAASSVETAVTSTIDSAKAAMDTVKAKVDSLKK
jgi:cell division protein FtsX